MNFSLQFRTIVKYVILTACGILLYVLAAKYAFTERGYFAIGGEGFLLLLPVIYGVTGTVIRDWIRDIKDHGRGVKRR
ncbi:MAG: hypothetical protein HFE97_12410 [Oscillospiraceae bacterium]|nr:hypothetical protein [Oscillospiraceae bacterium]